MSNSESFEAFILQAKSELEKELDEQTVSTAVFAMQKAKLLFTGSPIGTILRHNLTGACATRAVNSAGIPIWKVSSPDGGGYDSHEPILQPETDWSCIFNPDD